MKITLEPMLAMPFFGLGIQLVLLQFLVFLAIGVSIFALVSLAMKLLKGAGQTNAAIQPPPAVPATQIIPRKCPQCGAELKPDAPEGLCPACLLQHGLATEGGAPPGTPPFVPPGISELAKLFPQLEILEPIGTGGMGAVYKARQPSLDRLVALKILAPRSGADVDFAGRFTREARALARLSHPNIVAVYDFGQVQTGRAELPLGQEAPQRVPAASLSYFLMEYVDGPNLRQIQQAGKLAPREALQIIPQICTALQFAHDEGIVHRDIKPENVLLDKKGRVKIADFGLAKILGQEPKDLRLTGARDVMGTPHYMAPEQVEKPQEVDHRADIYSLGVVFYEMLTGELPLGKFQPPSHKVQVDVRLDEVVLRSLAKEPELRYQQVSEIKTRVETIASTSSPEKSAPLKAVEAWLAVMDGGNYAQSWEVAAPYFQRTIGKEEWTGRLQKVRCPLGEVFSRRLSETREPGGGRFEAKFDTSFDGLLAARETVTVARQKNGEWKAIGYLIRPVARFTGTAFFARHGWKRMLAWTAIIVAVLFGIHVFVLAPYRAATDSVSPEIPHGSHVFVFKLARHFAPGDVIVYRHDGINLLARVAEAGPSDGVLHVTKRNGPPKAVPMSEVVGRVVFNTRSEPEESPIRSDYIGKTWFPQGDSIEITSVERSAERLTVKGRYRLVSADSANLALNITSTNTTGFPQDPKQSKLISRGGGDFELSRSHLVVGWPHIAMYPVAGGASFANLYFGTEAEAQEESKIKFQDEQPATKTIGGFDPVMERVLLPATAGSNCFLNLETGEFKSPPPDVLDFFAKYKPWNFGDPSTESVFKWVEESGANFYLRPGDLTLIGGNLTSWRPVLGSNMFDVVSAQSVVWENETEENDRASGGRFMRHAIDLKSFSSPDYLVAFRTAGGRDGVLQALDYIRNPASVKIRYKLVQKTTPSANQPVQAESAGQLTQDGWKLWQERKLSEAAAKFRQAVELDPTDANAWNGLGWSLFNSGNADAAEAAFKKVLAIDPNHPAALNGLGQIYLSQRKYSEAENYLLKAAPQASAAWYGLARLYLLQGNFKQAEHWAQNLDDAGQADDTARKMLLAAKAKSLPEGLRLMLEPPMPRNVSAPVPNLIVNGSFETPPVTSTQLWAWTDPGAMRPWESYSLPMGNAAFGLNPTVFEVWTNGYAPPDSDLTRYFDPCYSADGGQNLEIIAEAVTRSYVQQTVRTTPGARYRLSFYHTPRPGAHSRLTVGTDVKVLASFDEDGTKLATFSWKSFTTNFTAESDSTTIRFFDETQTLGQGTHIDGVVLAPETGDSTLIRSVPEDPGPAAELRAARVKLEEMKMNYSPEHPKYREQLSVIQLLEEEATKQPPEPADLRAARVELERVKTDYSPNHPKYRAQLAIIRILEDAAKKQPPESSDLTQARIEFERLKTYMLPNHPKYQAQLAVIHLLETEDREHPNDSAELRQAKAKLELMKADYATNHPAYLNQSAIVQMLEKEQAGARNGPAATP